MEYKLALKNKNGYKISNQKTYDCYDDAKMALERLIKLDYTKTKSKTKNLIIVNI